MSSSSVSRSFACAVFSAVLALALNLQPTEGSPVAVLYETGGREHVHSFLQSVFTSLADAEVPGDPPPMFIDFRETKIKTSVEWLVGNETKSIVSLLDSRALHEFVRIGSEFGLSEGVKVFTPFGVQRRDSHASSALRVYSLQMSERALAHALMHRVTQVGCDAVVPVMDDPALLTSLHNYRVASPVQFLDPIVIKPGKSEGKGLKSIKKLMGKAKSGPLGVLLLSSKDAGEELAKTVWAGAQHSNTTHQLRWFSPKLLSHPEGMDDTLFGLYSVLFVGSGQWDNPDRRRLLKRLNKFTGPSPLILPAVLAYDAARLAKLSASGPLDLENLLIGMSGEIRFDTAGDRSDGVYFGLSAIPNSLGPSSPSSNPSPLLQPSPWVLEDLVNVVGHGEGHKEMYQIVDHQVATSSLFTREELLAVNVSGAAGGCRDEHLEVSTHDPFNQLSYAYSFNRSTLPPHLLIPNQYGFGLTFQCNQDDEGAQASLRVACTPYGRSLGETVHCFRSRVRRTRSPRPRPSSGRNRYSQRDDSGSNALYYQPPSSQYYSSYSAYSAPPTMGYYGGYMDSSTSGYLTTRLDVPISEDPPSTAAPPPGTSKLPELRQILKAAKPFVGSCIGSSTGCAICVLVLGRLPLGAVPAACTGPCFVGTFGTCGSLLGRVFAETTVICTELFEQGLLDINTFIADAEFGRHLLHTAPLTLKGYQMMATPLVRLMRKSRDVTRLVGSVALPWSRHMTYLMGHTEEWTFLGWFLHWLGVPICTMAGILGWGGIIRSILIGLFLILLTSIKLKGGNGSRSGVLLTLIRSR